ncbi:NAD-binding protein [Nitratiruptor sp. YY09-18]|uniref:NAD-binding protein n=1 Tax=Nitratiruptor sp. YY09-18 TaxID=2724901 RepID=UPI001916ADA1|nr:NAD-binding protein [Nitratiruptor sp. YY09-18]BCD68527.1 trk system potassium uptake protein [Nitratiruptor sp. YY09-18]
MDIIIAGAGRVGFKLAQTLSIKHNIIIIDKNQDALSRLTESIDVMPLFGNIEDPDTYKSLMEREYDIFIAVTDNDEANLISTLIADDAINVKKKIIRLRNPFFAKSSIAKKIGIHEAVFPFIAAASSIKLLLNYPKANNVKNFIFTPFTLVSVVVDEPQYTTMEELCTKDTIVVGIERNKKFLIPAKNEKIEQNDLLYLFGDKERIKELCNGLNRHAPKQIKKIAIFGAELLGLEIAKAFLEEKVELKIIETDPELCKRASEVLQNRATVINSRYIEHAIFEEENVKSADMIISTSSDDEDNIIRCLEAKEYGVKKSVAVNNDMEFYSLMHKLGIVAVRGPKMSAYYSILEKIASSLVISERHYCGGRGTIFMRKIFPNSHLIDQKIKPLALDDARFYIIRDGEIKPLEQKTTLKALDVIAVFSKSYLEERIKKWIYTL